MQGKVKFFNSSKGYGFIVDEETGDDVFVHVTSLNGLKINEGDKVEYVIEEGERGKTATNIQLV
ncbi:MAG: cold-shock protein [Flavobacteriaceae bacterium]|tara:strand:- start:467 stop:658 length:192 start_codon:yes stop_codon:yes gene_type:complete